MLLRLLATQSHNRMQDIRLRNQHYYVILRGHKHLGSGQWIEITFFFVRGGVKTEKLLRVPSCLPLYMKSFRSQTIGFCDNYVKDIY